MKRFFLLGGSLFLLSSVRGIALMVGSSNLPELPEDNLFVGKDDWYSIKLAYEGELVLSRNTKSSTGLSDIHTSTMINGAQVSFGFIDRVEIYTFLGAFKSFLSANNHGKHVSLKMEESFGGSLGARAMAICWGETKLGFEAQYFYGWPKIESLHVGGDSADSCSQSSQRQWQAGFSLSQRFAWLTPYVGASYTQFILEFSGLPSNLNLSSMQIENSNPFGVCIGLAIAGNKGPFFDVEATFLSEYAISALLGLRF